LHFKYEVFKVLAEGKVLISEGFKVLAEGKVLIL